MEQTVEFMTTKVSVAEIPLTDKFEFRPERGFHWLQKLLFWVLSKIGCFAVEKRQSFDRVVVQKQRFMHNLYEQEGELLRYYAYHGKYLLIGPEDLSRLLDEVIQPFGSPLSFTTEYKTGMEIHGMNVVVIPWMRGMLVVPKEVKLEG